MNHRRHVLALAVSLLLHQHVAVADLAVDWAPPAFGVYGDGSSWVGGSVPGADDIGVLGSQTTTTTSPNSVQFLSNQTARGSWIVSGEYDYRFGNPNLTFDVGRIVVGSNRTEFFEGMSYTRSIDGLPTSARLTIGVPSFSSPGQVVSGGITVGGPPFSGNAPIEGTLIIDGDGTLVETADLTVGGEGNTGRIEITGGAKLMQDGNPTLAEFTKIGGGSSRPPVLGSTTGSALIDGAGSSLTTTSSLEVGLTGTASVTASNGGVLRGASVIAGNRATAREEGNVSLDASSGGRIVALDESGAFGRLTLRDRASLNVRNGGTAQVGNTSLDTPGTWSA